MENSYDKYNKLREDLMEQISFASFTDEKATKDLVLAQSANGSELYTLALEYGIDPDDYGIGEEDLDKSRAR